MFLNIFCLLLQLFSWCWSRGGSSSLTPLVSLWSQTMKAGTGKDDWIVKQSYVMDWDSYTLYVLSALSVLPMVGWGANKEQEKRARAGTMFPCTSSQKLKMKVKINYWHPLLEAKSKLVLYIYT